MSETIVEKQIISAITTHGGTYPITTREIEETLGLSNPVVLKGLKNLQLGGHIHTKRVTWMKGFRNYHKLASEIWPTFLFSKCFDCHNKSTIKTCIFHNHLHESGHNCDLTRVKVRLTKNTVACPWFIPRGGRRRELPLEKFIKESTKQAQEVNRAARYQGENSTQNQLLPRYCCLFCSEPLYILGNGFIPLIGSSTIRCINCESLYKLVYSEKKEKFVVLCAEEKGDLFRQNYDSLAGEPTNTMPYSSLRYGIVIPFEGFYHLDRVAEVIIIANWVGKLSELKYIVTRSKKDFHELRTLLANDYSHIEIIDGEEILVSPSPTPQQVGILRLLRKLKLLNKKFCQATLESRLTVLQMLEGVVCEEDRKKALQTIKALLRKLARYQLLTIKDWNHLDGLAARALWKPVAELVEAEGFDFPGRCLGRYVKDPFKPFSQYYAYSAIDSIINGLFLKMSENIKEYCTKINLCWDGLLGICHGETHGGVFGFHLDLIEPFKQTALVTFCKAIANGDLEEEDVRKICGRRRQTLYCIDSESELNKKLKSLIEQTLNLTSNNCTIKTGLENYFFGIKIWLRNLVIKNHQNKITHHKQEFNFNVIMEYQLWQFLGDVQRNKIVLILMQLLEEITLEPFTFRYMNKE